MAIVTDKNSNYGPPLVSQKYSPLNNINWQAADEPTYSALLVNRSRLFTTGGLLPQPLDLALPNWANAAGNEVGHLPPLVVVSSNRANWIKAGIDAGEEQLLSLGIPSFANASDLRALTAQVGQSVSPPIYAPSRIGANRNVYVVVQMAEYVTYKSVLAGTNITPVGWQFKRGNGGPRKLGLVGFGATRFAAMEFCKQLRQRAAAVAGGPAPWNLAWLLDDNVVALTGFAGFAAAEATVGPDVACAGFSGGTKAEAQTWVRDWASGELLAGRGAAPAALPASVPLGIVQQAALWNVNYFSANHLNFGPTFIASAEDLSIANYFNVTATPYRFYNGITVYKELPKYDNGAGARQVDLARKKLAAWTAAAEGASPPAGHPPPPLKVQPVDPADGGVQTLATFVVERVLPASAMSAHAGDADVQNTAKCQGVEQMTAGALNHFGCVGVPAQTATFQINGPNPQVVNQRDVP